MNNNNHRKSEAYIELIEEMKWLNYSPLPNIMMMMMTRVNPLNGCSVNNVDVLFEAVACWDIYSYIYIQVLSNRQQGTKKMVDVQSTRDGI